MYEEKDGKTTITCDKCSTSQTVKTKNASEALYKNGWAFNSQARKYKHLCVECNKKRELQAILKNKRLNY